MKRAHRMLMIGAAGRNVGKTEFACSLIARFAEQHEIIGVKVTTVTERDGTCPRGGQGCGVCSSLQGNFAIVEETGEQPGKDTARLLAAGAKRVLWLRVLKDSLADGFAELQKQFTPGALIVCESNSLRRVVEPDLFFVVTEKGAAEAKPSGANVMQYADRVVLSDGVSFDLSVDDIDIADDRWIMRREATAIVLAGGSSTRMQRDKSLLPIGGVSMIEYIVRRLRPHFKEIIIGANDAAKYAFLGERVVPDQAPGQGPLMGVLSSLEAAQYDIALIAACDMPGLDLDLIYRMFRESEGFDGVVPQVGENLYEPLFAVYRKEAIPAVRASLASGKRRADGFFGNCRIKFINQIACTVAKNINTFAEYEEFRKKHDDTI